MESIGYLPWPTCHLEEPTDGTNGFGNPIDENNLYPLSVLMDKYEKSVGRNATLIIGLTPDPSGLLPKGDVQRLKEMGNEIKRRFDTATGFYSRKQKKSDA